MHRRHRPVVVAAVVLALAACGGRTGGAPPVTPPAPLAREPAASLADVERALLAAPAWQATVRVRATGRFVADLTVTVAATQDNRARIDALGTFDGKPVQVAWTSDSAPAPHTTEAIVIGMTRMGVLHNVAMLIMGGKVPDHAEGGVREWVVPTGEKVTAGGALAFGLSVSGKPSGDVVLVTTPSPQGPVMARRTITVHFDEGDMSVEEEYTFDFSEGAF